MNDGNQVTSGATETRRLSSKSRGRRKCQGVEPASPAPPAAEAVAEVVVNAVDELGAAIRDRQSGPPCSRKTATLLHRIG